VEPHEPKSGPDSALGSQDGAVIFMSDASAEADRLSAALRGRGYTVVDVPLGLLAGRAAVQRPAAVICDADAPGTLETLRRMQSAAGGRTIEVVLVGETASTSEPGRAELEAESSGFFTRPVSADELVSKVEQIIGPGNARGSSPTGSGGRPAVLVAAARRPYRYEGHRLGARSPLSVAPPPPSAQAPSSGQSPPSSAPPASPGRPSTLPPAVTSRSGSVVPQPMGVVPHARLSPELEQLLGRAEQRVRQAVSGSTAVVERLSPEAEVEAVLPAELLAALDEPLDIDDEDVEDSAAGTAGGSEGGKGGTRGTTSDAGAGTAAGGGRTAARRETTASGPAAPVPEVAPPAPAAAPDEAEFQKEMPTAAPLRPSQLPPPSLRSKTTLEPPSVMLESIVPPPARAEGKESEHPPSIPSAANLPNLPTVAPGPPITTKPPKAEPSRAEPTRSEHVRPPTQPPASQAAKFVEPSTPDIPAVLGEGDGFRAVARAVAARFGGSIAFEDSAGIRRAVFRDGDFVTAASSGEAETLVAFLAERGDIAPDVAQRIGRRVPPFGRHAGAALIAQGHLRQDELWPVLRSHAEWIIGRVARMQRGAASLEFEVPQRLQAEPGVFGGATGAEVLLEIARRVVSPAEALLRLNGRNTALAAGATHGLLAECALSEVETTAVKGAIGGSVGAILDRTGGDDFASVVWALVELGVLSTESAPRPRRSAEPEDVPHDPLDALALRERIATRRGLVEEGDYFALLGVARGATSYDVRRAYMSVRKSFDPARILTAETVDLKDDLESILEVLDEAYEILGDSTRRERYRRALDAVPR
jgi:CheY-like chemotaxis protein